MRPHIFHWLFLFAVSVSLAVGAEQTFPRHWGQPPAIQTRDFRPLPGGYGYGSSTLAKWIQQNLDRDAGGRVEPRGTRVGKGMTVSGELRQGRNITLTLEGPPPDDAKRDYRVSIRLLHESGAPQHEFRASPAREYPGCWQVRFTADKPGEWIWRVSFRELNPGETSRTEVTVPGFDGRSGSFTIAADAK